MPTKGLTEPEAVELEFEPLVRFANGDVIDCQSATEAIALAAAWRIWPHSPDQPTEARRAIWRTGFASGAVWAQESADGRVE